MVNPETKSLAEFYPMRVVVDATKEMVKDAIADNLDLKTMEIDASRTFKMVDLGSSTGPNTFIVVQNIIEAVEQKYLAQHQNPSALEFQVFFNDHYDNDFNTLFKSLPPSRNYFATGVPGSFHSRLFPNSTLHFVYSSYALHWPSKVPEEIVDRKSPAWNKGSIQCTGFVKEVAEAYAVQFKNDMECFLNARAEELVGGGLMVIVISTLPNEIPMSNTTEGRNGLFTIERTNILAYAAMEKTFSAVDSTSKIRAVFEGLIKEHFGNEVVNQIFNHFTTKLLTGNILTIDDLENHNKIDLFISLKRNDHQLI
ncbi:hypothetical protein Pint_18683 [Pistacia integerrima]|uniref:Uncharacterized protein n=1 Tax=Pistacia integerrima TaxID=434235 RepID=A0ACC0YV03_9ROSI|nr:hypothetical protein Pint_18683 [Pistacia integerrima]